MSDIKMEPTSVWKIKDIDNIWMYQEGDKMSLLIKNKDDLTKILLTGDAIKNHNDNFPVVLKSDMDAAKDTISSLKRENEELKDKLKKLEQADMLDKEAADYWSKKHDTLLRRMRKLQEENEKNKETSNMWKKEAADCLKLRDEAQKEAYKLKKENEELQGKYNLERAANEAHHRFFHQYAGRGTEIEFNYAIDEAYEVTYVIVDKDRYRTLKADSYCAMIHGKIYNTSQLVDRILELEKLKTPTLENFADEKSSTRADILDQAKKCVCGQREQDYGTPESNFQLIADLWNGYLGFTSYVLELEEYLMDLKDKGIDIDINVPEPKAIFPEDVAMMMALLKIARIKNGGGSGDSFVDLAGYAACGGEIWAEKRKSKDQK